MKLSKKEEKELLKVYDAWWESYLNGDIKTYDSYLDDDFRFVGSTGGEEFLNRKDTTAFFEATADQLAGKAKLENVIRTIEPIDGIVLVTDLADAYILDGTKWVYYARFRFTSLLRKTSNGWRFFYQHFSTPDLKAEEGETLGLDKITSENLELRNAIKRRTAELEIKNRDLEVEAALERIRAKVTAMNQSSDLLDIVVTMRTEFVKLGHEAHYFWHMRWLPDMYQKAMTSGDGSRIGMIMELPRDFHSHYEGMTEWENNKEPFIVLALETEIAVDYIDKMIRQGDFQQVDPNAPSLDDVRHIGGLTFVSARTEHGEIGYSLPGVVKNPPKEDLDILVRFAGAFDMAHKRFEDLKRSENQAREVQIELGLEKVRSRAMAMQDSSELSQLVDTVFKELAILDFALQACIINLIDIDNLCNTVWMKSPDVGNIPDSYLMKFENYPFHDAMKEGYLKREAKFIYTIQGAEKKEYDKYLFKDTEFRKISQEAQDSFTSLEKYVCSFTFSNFGGLQTIGQEPLSDENLDILARFGKVFDLTYTRFNDLKLAEAQARESRIELSLERVRARTMAMQQSEELIETAILLQNEFRELGFNQFFETGYILYDEEIDTQYLWMSNFDGSGMEGFTLPMVGDKVLQLRFDAWKRKDPVFCVVLEGETLVKHIEFILPLLSSEDITDQVKNRLPDPTYLYSGNFSHGFLTVVANKKLSEEQEIILARFSGVFEQTYTRFLDLQKAEAQAREAQIETALERVRSRSIGMQNSEELKEVIQIIFDQLGLLNINAEHAGIVVDYKAREDWHFWVAETQDIPSRITVPYLDSVWDRQFTEAKKKGKDFFTTQLNFEEKNKFYEGLLPHIQGLTKKARNFYLKCPGLAASTVVQDDIGLYIENFDGTPYSKEENSVLRRFGMVFQQTYTRFIDLQKAEAQARESQIEAALERVRARAMGLHKSDELKEVIAILYNQLSELGLELYDGNIVIHEKSSNALTFWGSGLGGVEMPPKFTIPYLDRIILKKLYYENDISEKFRAFELKGKELKNYHKIILTETEFKDTPKEYQDEMLSVNRIILSNIAIEHGWLEVASDEFLSKSQAEILLRFGSVVDLTYTRFADLQKAEAQAREAEIELALERIRARTMAMQHSTELADTSALLFQQIQMLGISPWSCGFNIWEKEDTVFTSYMGSPDGGLLKGYKIPLTEEAAFIRFKESRDRGDKLFIDILEGDALEKHYQYFHTLPGIKEMFEEQDQAGRPLPSFQIHHLANFSHGNLMFITYEHYPEAHDIFIRFAKVFEQTYTRFLDLQKAEAQAREAQIETALERVRSRTMAMQKSDELLDAAEILSAELVNLEIPHFMSGFVLFNETTEKQVVHMGVPGQGRQSKFYLPLKGDAILKMRYKNWKNSEPIFYQRVEGEKLAAHMAYVTQHFGSEEMVETGQKIPDPVIFYCGNFKEGYVHILSEVQLNKEQESILARFTKIFQQTYTRFLDLQKAEAQAREAQIEAALERVRSKTMAMHSSNDVEDTVITLFEEVLNLGLDPSIRCGIGILEGFEGMETRSTNRGPDGKIALRVGMLDMSIHPMLVGLKKAWKAGDKGYSYEYSKEDVKIYYKALNDEPEYPFNADLKALPEREFHNSFFFSSGILFAFTEDPLSEESFNILNRFAQVFDQTYRRFLDLQKAEAQAKEAQIEAALERVRARTMAMQRSEELLEVATVLFKQVKELGVPQWNCGFNIWNIGDKEFTYYPGSPDGVILSSPCKISLTEHPVFRRFDESRKRGDELFVYEKEGEEQADHYQYMLSHPGVGELLQNMLDSGYELPKFQIDHIANFSYGNLIFITYEHFPEMHDVFKRFAKVFEQTYTRFLDLQKAEAQAKEAQIEAALEKVRARTMAMQSSDELQEAANLLFLEVQGLGINAWSAGYNILNEDKTQSVCWMSSEGELQDPFPLYFTKEASFKAMGKFLKSDADFFVQELGGKALKQHYDYMISIPELEDTFQHIQDVGLTLPDYQINHLCKFKQGFLLFITYEKSPEAHDIFKRFTKVFEQTYTRFLDLQKAESQSKESQIELALERVRASSMAMHESEQMAETAEVLFEQFDLLGIIPDRISIAIFNEKKKLFELWSTDQSGTLVNHGHDFSIEEPTCMAKTYKAWKEGKATFTVDLKGKELEDWIRYVKEEAKMELDESKFKGRRVQHCAFFSQGYLLLSSHLPISDETEQLLVRFTKVFQQTYTRFLDLQKAETQAREAIKRTSVDRVRAEIASMRTGTDLNRITPLVWNELTTLDVPFIRCGVFIMDEETQQVQTHLSTPDGKAIASFQLPFKNTAPLDQLLPYWRRKEMFTDFWDEEAFIESTKILMQRGAITSSEKYITENQPTSLYLHFLPFLQGMLYVGSEVSLSKDELSLVQNLAEAFSSAYARYEDFNKLELANKKIEKTLIDLKQTQAQLIQSEKMASLGELTAGIAHEIQNPLNFVNNFSEVSHELMKEMQEEIENGDLAEAKEIGNDIEQNLEKINHHGQRASEIVKGMLQHSRSSSGNKELTDVNALADEYLRLAYHGLRAKDKTFNAKLETEFDPGLDKINIVPQDIGRVILNLITNAFYAVNEKKNQEIAGYEPMVSVCTKLIKGSIEISVKDNGNGIPKKALDKIFQPFFTTKPTGQGTGLGLSLSYDIIKAHGGELKVETKEEVGTTFIIQLTTL